jgi:hypothetical protein
MFGSLKYQIYVFLGLVLLIFVISLLENTLKSGQQWEIHFRFGPVPIEKETPETDVFKPVGPR